MKLSSKNVFAITFFFLWAVSNYGYLLFDKIPHPENIFFLTLLGYFPFSKLHILIEKKVAANKKTAFSFVSGLVSYLLSAAILILITWVITWLA